MRTKYENALNEFPTQEQVNTFLYALQRSGKVNMFGAAPYVRDEFPALSVGESRQMTTAWMQGWNEKDAGLTE